MGFPRDLPGRVPQFGCAKYRLSHDVEVFDANSSAGAPDADSVRTQILAISLGTRIELRLKNEQKISGTRGVVSDSGFTLVDVTGERQIAFDDVTTVKQLKSHTKRNILIGAGIALAAVAAVLVTLALRSRFSGY